MEQLPGRISYSHCSAITVAHVQQEDGLRWVGRNGRNNTDPPRCLDIKLGLGCNLKGEFTVRRCGNKQPNSSSDRPVLYFILVLKFFSAQRYAVASMYWLGTGNPRQNSRSERSRSGPNICEFHRCTFCSSKEEDSRVLLQEHFTQDIILHVFFRAIYFLGPRFTIVSSHL